MIAYKNAMKEMSNLKEPITYIKKQSPIIKYPMHKPINSTNKIIPFQKRNISELINKPTQFIKMKIADKNIDNYTNNIDKLYSLDIKVKSINDKPPEYYQYNMQNKTIEDFRLDALQNENNIKSNMTILKEENDSNKSLNEIKTDEDDFQTNLNMILNEYKNKQNDINRRENEPTDKELIIKTNIINNKLERLTDKHNKLPIVFKTFTKPSEPIISVAISEEDKMIELINSVFVGNKDLLTKNERLQEKVNLLSEEKELLFIKFAEDFREKTFKNYKPTKKELTKFFNQYYEKANNYIETLESEPLESEPLESSPFLTTASYKTNDNIVTAKNAEKTILNSDEILLKIINLFKSDDLKITEDERNDINMIAANNSLGSLNKLTQNKVTVITWIKRQIKDKKDKEEIKEKENTNLMKKNDINILKREIK